MSSPKFFGLKVDEDPQFFIDNINKITQIMHVTSLELASYQLKDITHDWIK